MKNVHTYFCLVLFFTYFMQITSKAENSTTINYSKMSATELDTAFIAAVQENDSEKMQKLIQAGANVNTPVLYTETSGDCDWQIESTALMYAVRNNCPNMIKVLVKVKNKLNESLTKALNEAIKKGYSDIVKELIKGGADINNQDVNENKDTPLILAIKYACPNAEFSSQAQAKRSSRWYERKEIIKMILKAGADVSCVNKYGRTALMEAVIQHDLNTVLDLLNIPAINTGSFFGFGTKPKNYADQDGNTALIYAVKYIRSNYIDNQEYNLCKNSQTIVEALLKSPGIDPHHVNKNGETAIILLEKLNKK